MAILRLPASVTGLKAATATVHRWAKQPGSCFAKGDLLVELEVDESFVHVEAAVAGTLGRILAESAKTIALGADLAEFASDSTSPTPPPQPNAQTDQPKASGGKVTPILMPQAGNTMEEGRVLQWKVKVGDRVTVGQVLFEVETDKATVEVEATDAGRLARIVAPEGTVVPVKQPVAYLAENDADVGAYLAAVPAAPSAVADGSRPVATEQSVPTTTKAESGRVKASPAARKLAVAAGLDLAAIGPGSGPGGRILSADLARTTPAEPPPTPVTGDRRPMSRMRRAIAVNLQTSKQTIPHFYLKHTVNADPLFAFYKAQKPTTGCTLNDVVLLAVGKTVFEFPAFRCRLDGNDLIETANANIGVAVTIEDGLVVPVVMAVETHTLATLPSEARRVVEAARKGKLENIGKGVFTISNMGMLGVEDFAPIINPPEAGILGISAVRESVIVKDGVIRPARVMSLTLSVDHRIVDGAVAAAFMMKLRERLENPESLSQVSPNG